MSSAIECSFLEASEKKLCLITLRLLFWMTLFSNSELHLYFPYHETSFCSLNSNRSLFYKWITKITNISWNSFFVLINTSKDGNSESPTGSFVEIFSSDTSACCFGLNCFEFWLFQRAGGMNLLCSLKLSPFWPSLEGMTMWHWNSRKWE